MYECHVCLHCADCSQPIIVLIVYSQPVLNITCRFSSPKRIMQVNQPSLQQSTFCSMCHLPSGAYHLVLTTMATMCKVITVCQVSQVTVSGHVQSCEQYSAPALSVAALNLTNHADKVYRPLARSTARSLCFCEDWPQLWPSSSQGLLHAV